MNDKRRMINVFGCAINGLRLMVRTQRNAKIHLIGTIAVVFAGFALRVSESDWCWLIASIAAVWTAEAINTSIEALTDLISPEFHPAAGMAKDVAAGAVLVAATGAAIIGITVLRPYMFGKFLWH